MVRVVIQKITDYTEDYYNRFKDYISWQKLERIQKFKQREDYKRSLLADVLSRTMLSQMLGVNPAEHEIGVDDMGKPYVKNAKKTYFNVSHSGEYVACIISDKPCGIDIEMMEGDNLDIAKCFFTPNEYVYIAGGPKGQIKHRFYEIWTAKEAYCKYEGKGLGIDFGSFEVVKRNDMFYSVRVNGKEKQIVNVRSIVEEYMLSFVCEDESEIIVETEFGGLYGL